jgi:hypothetical protein
MATLKKHGTVVKQVTLRKDCETGTRDFIEFEYFEQVRCLMSDGSVLKKNRGKIRDESKPRSGGWKIAFRSGCTEKFFMEHIKDIWVDRQGYKVVK